MKPTEKLRRSILHIALLGAGPNQQVTGLTLKQALDKLTPVQVREMADETLNAWWATHGQPPEGEVPLKHFSRLREAAEQLSDRPGRQR